MQGLICPALAHLYIEHHGAEMTLGWPAFYTWRGGALDPQRLSLQYKSETPQDGMRWVLSHIAEARM